MWEGLPEQQPSDLFVKRLREAQRKLDHWQVGSIHRDVQGRLHPFLRPAVKPIWKTTHTGSLWAGPILTPVFVEMCPSRGTLRTVVPFGRPLNQGAKGSVRKVTHVMVLVRGDATSLHTLKREPNPNGRVF